MNRLLDIARYLDYYPQSHPFKAEIWIPLILQEKQVRGYIHKKKFCMTPVEPDGTRAKHAQRVAYLVVHGWDDAIEIDVGVPSIPGDTVDFPTWDGNHRLAAAIFRGDEYIEAGFSGDEELIEELLWLGESNG